MTKGKVVAVKFKTVALEQQRDAKGRYTSRFVCRAKVTAVNRKDQGLLDKMLEPGYYFGRTK